jgi:hypothetical protein
VEQEVASPPGSIFRRATSAKTEVTLNDHPEDGVQNYEDGYEDMANALDHDTSTEDPIHFDITDRPFLKAFFNVLHRPLEDQGMDFWWIDWKQGEYSRVKGVDLIRFGY